jgi:cbb3-type cytochrome oxidase subunit 3
MANDPERNEENPSPPENPGSRGNSTPNDTRVIPADAIEKVPFMTSFSQKVFIAVFTLILIAIAVTFYDAGSRENSAAQATFSVAAQPIINSVAESTGLRTSYGYPAFTLNAKTKEADIFAEFLHGPLPPEKASLFGMTACARLARAYVVKGYMPRHLTVHVYSRQENGPRRYYGKAVFNGNLDDLVWEGAPEHI